MSAEFCLGANGYDFMKHDEYKEREYTEIPGS